MAAFCIIVGLLGYAVAALVFVGAPSAVQEIGALLIAINASLLFIAGLFTAKLAPRTPAKAE